MANLTFNTGKVRMIASAAGEINYLSDIIVVIALEVDDEPDDPDIEFVSDLLADATEVSSTGYTGGFEGAGRISLGSKTIAVNQTDNSAEMDAANVVWTAISRAAAEVWAAIAVAKELTSDAASPLMGKIDTGTGLPLTPNGSDITLTVAGTGLLRVT